MLADRYDSGDELKRIAVDLTHLRAGGEQGGAKLVVLRLLDELANLAPQIELRLLTVDRSHAELSSLDRDNVRRVCVMREPDPSRPMTRVRGLVREQLARALPAESLLRLRRAYWAVRYREQRSLGGGNGPDLLFSPLTTAALAQPGVPLVATIHDLQHVYYPEFFTPEQRSLRAQQLEDVCARATRIVCVSEHVRQSLLSARDLPPDRVSVVHHALVQALPRPSAQAQQDALRELGLQAGEFLLYPANFWPHKNHPRLLEAFAAYAAARPASTLQLVCPGAPDERLEGLCARANTLGIAQRVRFPGYVPAARLAALFQACRALIFPSLFEGFGLPVLEAMAFDKPVLCSGAASLPEVVGEAALLFDPTDPSAMASAIDRLESDASLSRRLVELGRERVRAFGSPRRMAEQYLAVFRAAVAA
jgi:glycosyltransferase involved in cell wall biosynthesis